VCSGKPDDTDDCQTDKRRDISVLAPEFAPSAPVAGIRGGPHPIYLLVMIFFQYISSFLPKSVRKS